MKRLALLILGLSVAFISSCADIKLAKEYYAQGNYPAAVKELRPLVKRGFPQAYYLYGKLIVEGKVKGVPPEEGVKFLELAYEKGIKKALLDIAKFYLKEGEVDKAIKYLRLASEEGVPGAQELLIKTLIKNNRVNERVIGQALALARQNPQLYKLLANYYLEKGNVKRAEKLLEKAYKAGIEKAGLTLASLLIREGKLSEAEKLLEELYVKYGDKEAALKLGKIYEIRAKSLKLSYCPIVTAKTPEEFFKAKLKLQAERKEYLLTALKWYERALPLLEAQYRVARVKWELSGNSCGDFKTILRFAKLGAKPAIADLQRLYGAAGRCPAPPQMEQERKELRGLKELYGVEVKATKENPSEVLFKRGMELLKYNPEKALKLLEEACSYGNTKAEIELALLLKDKNPQIAGAVLYYYAKVKGVPRAMVALAKLYLSAGNEEKYLYWIEKAAKLRYTPAMRLYALYLINHNREELAIKLLKEWEEEGYCFAAILLGAIYEGDYGDLPIDFKKAEFHYKLAVENGCVDGYYRLARLYNFLDRPKEALPLAEEYHRLVPSQVKGLVLLTRIEMNLNNYQRAGSYLSQAIEMGYIPTYNEIAQLARFIPTKLLLSGQVRYRSYMVVAMKLGKSNFPLSFCLAYEAGLHKTPRAAMLMFNLASLVNTREDALAIINAGKRENYCKNLIERRLVTVVRVLKEGR
ncbi:SEL1-like repeat protein [Thermovibrio ammonificans]